MTKGTLTVVALFSLLGACTQRLACPAYQSSFIYDKEHMRQKFSYFNADSTPKVLTASKNKYLVAVPESYRKKYRRLQTVEMNPIYPVIPDSLKTQDSGDEFLLAESDMTDSAAVAKNKIEPGDSAYAITKTKEKFNMDQDLYMWYFREILVLPDVRAALEKKEEQKKQANVKTDTTNRKKEDGGGLKNLFKKKDKSDSTISVNPVDNSGVNSPQEPKKKKGGLFKRKQDPDPIKKEGGE